MIKMEVTNRAVGRATYEEIVAFSFRTRILFSLCRNLQ